MAVEKEVLHGPIFMAAMALAAEMGGAVGVKADGAEDVAVISRIVKIPVMGMQWEADPSGKRWVTPTFKAADALIQAGCDIVALAGAGGRPYGDPVPDLIRHVHDQGKAVMVDVATLEEARAMEREGADLLRPTYRQATPDFDFVAAVAKAVSTPVVAEGGYWRPEEVAKAFQLGCYCAVVGTAITRPADITKYWVRTINQG